MTFLLFLAALGLLHYVLGRAGESAAESGSTDGIAPKAEPESVGGTPGVWALGRALEERGRGPNAGAQGTAADRAASSPRVPSGV